MTNKIQVLSERVANKIAAGEVVERPASIVKELLENSMDAGATSIEITVHHGGKSLIRVADNGCGMAAQDAELAFKRHATSKIKSDEDLTRIASFGFRGEALPSIAAVSRMTMVTKPADTETGTEIWMVGGALAKSREATAAVGTTVEVRDLFFNTPARRKFLKQDATEFGHIYDVVAAAALAKPAIRFLFQNQEKVVWDLPFGQDLAGRVKTVLGADWGEMLIPVEAQIPHVRVSGFVTRPEFARGNRLAQYFFVNQRWVKSFAVSFAVEAGYHGFLMHGRHPAAVLFVDVHPEYVDVNVHPTKQQVRLSGETSIKSMIQNAVLAALRGVTDLRPTLADKPLPILKKNLSNPVFEQDFLKPKSTTPEVSENSSVWESLLRETAIPALKAQEPAAEVFAPVSENRLRITKILGQVHGTFIIAETEEGYVIIDQHAAHEKVQYESLRRNLEKAEPVAQKLLIEEILDLNPRHFALYQETAPFLKKIGFEIEPFGEQTIVVRAAPHALRDENIKAVLTAFFEQKETGEPGVHLENYRAELAAMLACKTRSVKAHDSLTNEEMTHLVEELMRCNEPFHCPHGRPSMLKYSFAELERQFKRKL